MPPMVPDNESDGGSASEELDTIPAKQTQPKGKGKGKGKGKAKSVEEPEPVEDGDEEEDEDEYVVEKILSHDFSPDGTPLYEVKWAGYEKKSDRTWEPESNLSGALDIFNAYIKKIGGKPVFEKPAPKKGKRKSAALDETPASTPQSSAKAKAQANKKAKLNGLAELQQNNDSSATKKRDLPEGSWEGYIQAVDTIEELPIKDKKGKITSQLAVFVLWNDDTKTRHPMSLIRTKCPQKLIDYYEQHLVFKSIGVDETGPTEDPSREGVEE